MELAGTLHGGHSLPPSRAVLELEFILSRADYIKTTHFVSHSVNKCWEFTQWAGPADILPRSLPPGTHRHSVGPRLWDLV